MSKTKTIKEIADELGVAKQSVFYKIKKPPLSDDLDPFITKDEGVFTVSPEGEKLIKEAFGDDKQLSTIVHTSVDNQTVFFDILKAEIDAKNDLIIKQQKTIDELTAAIKDRPPKEPKIILSKYKRRKILKSLH